MAKTTLPCPLTALSLRLIIHIMSKGGLRLRSKTMTAQINEALCKVLCHNLCVVIQSQHELGIETDFSIAEAA